MKCHPSPKHRPQTVCVCVCSIVAMHPEGMGRYYALAITSYYTTFSPVQKPTVRPARLLSNTMLNIGKTNIKGGNTAPYSASCLALEASCPQGTSGVVCLLIGSTLAEARLWTACCSMIIQ